MMNDYVAEKLRELENERLSGTFIAAKIEGKSLTERPKAKPVIGPALRFAGRTLRRVGAGLEDWAEPPINENEQRLRMERRAW